MKKTTAFPSSARAQHPLWLAASADLEVEIPEIPHIPPRLLQKFSNENVVFFIGAGISRIIGCKDWNSLAKSLVDICFDNDLINYKKMDSIKKINDPKKVITISNKILDENGKIDLFFNKIEESLIPQPDLLAKFNIYEELAQIPACFITTNIDEIFDPLYERRTYYQTNTFNDVRIKRDALFKIHGTISDRDSIVFTVQKYLTQYNDPDLIEFLSGIFSSHTIVFIGYGMSEYEVLDFLVSKIGGKVDLKHWILLPYYDGEEYLVDYDNKYYNLLGVEVISYQKDKNGYASLYDVIKSWKNDIIENTNLLVEAAKEVDDTVSKFVGRKG